MCRVKIELLEARSKSFLQDRSSRSKVKVPKLKEVLHSAVTAVVAARLRKDQKKADLVWRRFESRSRVSRKLLKEELSTRFSPKEGFCPGYWPTSGVLDLCAFALIFA